MTDPLDDFDIERDSILSYYLAIEEIGKRVRQGEPVPDFMLSEKGEE